MYPSNPSYISYIYTFIQDCSSSLLLLPPATFYLTTPMHADSATSPHRDVLLLIYLLTYPYACCKYLSQLCQLQPVGPKVAPWSGFLIRTSRHRETGCMVSRYEDDPAQIVVAQSKRFVLVSPLPSLACTNEARLPMLRFLSCCVHAPLRLTLHTQASMFNHAGIVSLKAKLPIILPLAYRRFCI